MNLTDETIRHAIAGLLDTAPDPSPNPPATLESAATGFARRSVRPWLAVAGLTAAAVVVIVAVTIRSTSDERVATVAPADTTIDTSAYTTNAVAAAPLFDTGPSPVQWETFNPPGVAAARLTTLTAGPGGFVATGGSAGDPHGHLWFSTDATTWTEPATAVFAPITHVAAALATSDWFFIYGAPDSTTSEAIGPWQLFRSDDGQTWTPIPSTADTPGIASFTSVGNTLIRWNPLTEETAISTDGQQWTPADTQFIPVFPGSRARGAGTTFFTGLVDDTLTAFVSVRNGQWGTTRPPTRPRRLPREHPRRHLQLRTAARHRMRHRYATDHHVRPQCVLPGADPRATRHRQRHLDHHRRQHRTETCRNPNRVSATGSSHPSLIRSRASSAQPMASTGTQSEKPSQHPAQCDPRRGSPNTPTPQ